MKWDIDMYQCRCLIVLWMFCPDARLCDVMSSSRVISSQLAGVRSQYVVVSALQLCHGFEPSLMGIGIRSASLHVQSWDSLLLLCLPLDKIVTPPPWLFWSPFSLQKQWRAAVCPAHSSLGDEHFASHVLGLDSFWHQDFIPQKRHIQVVWRVSHDSRIIFFLQVVYFHAIFFTHNVDSFICDSCDFFLIFILFIYFYMHFFLLTWDGLLIS